jgi:hypothetical protein
MRPTKCSELFGFSATHLTVRFSILFVTTTLCYVLLRVATNRSNFFAVAVSGTRRRLFFQAGLALPNSLSRKLRNINPHADGMIPSEASRTPHPVSGATGGTYCTFTLLKYSFSAVNYIFKCPDVIFV